MKDNFRILHINGVKFYLIVSFSIQKRYGTHHNIGIYNVNNELGSLSLLLSYPHIKISSCEIGRGGQLSDFGTLDVGHEL